MTGPESQVDLEWKKMATVVVVILAAGIWEILYYKMAARSWVPNRAI
jgi:hypothetical protein